MSFVTTQPEVLAAEACESTEQWTTAELARLSVMRADLIYAGHEFQRNFEKR